MNKPPVPCDMPLPPLLHDVATIGGGEAVTRFVRQLGGRTLYVPKRPTAAFVTRVGADLAPLLSTRFGGSRVTVPMGPFGRSSCLAQAIRSMIAEAHSTAAIAGALGVSARTVQRHRARLKGA